MALFMGSHKWRLASSGPAGKTRSTLVRQRPVKHNVKTGVTSPHVCLVLLDKTNHGGKKTQTSPWILSKLKDVTCQSEPLWSPGRRKESAESKEEENITEARMG